MNNRNRKILETKLTTTTATLLRYLVNKSSQARKLVQLFFIAPILRDGFSLWESILDYQDGQPARDKVLRLIHKIQRQTVLVGILERDERKKRLGEAERKEKRKKQYGFDFFALAYIDELCDNLIQQVCAFGQIHKPQNKGQDGSTV